MLGFTVEKICRIHDESNPFWHWTRFVVKSVFTWRHGGHIGVPRKSCGSWTLFLCKCFLFFQKICIEAGHLSEYALYLQLLGSLVASSTSTGRNLERTQLLISIRNVLLCQLFFQRIQVIFHPLSGEFPVIEDRF